MCGVIDVRCARAARLAKGIAEGLPECVFEDKGFFVVNKLLDVASPSEVLAIAAKLLPESLRLTSPQQGQNAWRGNNLLFKLVEALVSTHAAVTRLPANGCFALPGR